MADALKQACAALALAAAAATAGAQASAPTPARPATPAAVPDRKSVV